MHRLLLALPAVLLTFALVAPMALATEFEPSGSGLIGETDDKIVTNAGFILIAFFPLFIFFMSMLQWRLEKRKDARKAASKSVGAHPRGGW